MGIKMEWKVRVCFFLRLLEVPLRWMEINIRQKSNGSTTLSVVTCPSVRPTNKARPTPFFGCGERGREEIKREREKRQILISAHVRLSKGYTRPTTFTVDRQTQKAVIFMMRIALFIHETMTLHHDDRNVAFSSRSCCNINIVRLTDP